MPKVIGDGTLGQAMAKAIKVKALGKSDEKIESDIVFICVPTPTIKGKQDLSEVEQAINRIQKADIIVIRSTILPGTTDRLQTQNEIPIMFIPEFGKEKTLEYEIANPEFHIFGMTEKSMPVGGIVLEILPPAKMIRMNAISAEFAKYFSNIWKATKIALANSFYDWVMAETKNEPIYQQAVNGLIKQKDISSYGWNIKQNGKRGYAGKCLPKDIQAAIGQYPHIIWKVIEKYNNKLQILKEKKLKIIDENN